MSHIQNIQYFQTNDTHEITKEVSHNYAKPLVKYQHKIECLEP